jgi:uncharacterized membrane protein
VARPNSTAHHCHLRGVTQRSTLGLAGTTVSAALFALVQLGGGVYALFIPPILLPTALCILFTGTLRTGAVPLITRFAQHVRGELPPDLRHYTGQVTVLWSVAFAALAVSATLLALFASPPTWSIMTNVVHYLFLGALFLGEYLVRLYKFQHLEHPSFVAYVRLLITTRVHNL